MKTTPYYFTIFSLLFSGSLPGQFATSFSDGHLDAWQGDTSHFMINPQQQLQLNAPSGSTSSWMFTPVTFTDSMVWEFYLKLDFAPSTSNQLRIFLGTTSPDLLSASGYFIEIGAGGDLDPLALKYRDHGNDIPLAASIPGLAASPPVEFKLRVIKNNKGDWLCYALEDSSAELLFSIDHDLLPVSTLSYFGIHCKYSESRRDKFSFDDISIQPIVADTIAPQWLSVDVIDSTTIILSFDEVIEEISALSISNYTLTPGNESPIAVETDGPDIVLHWTKPFENMVEYVLMIQSIRDYAGNTILPSQQRFTYLDFITALPNGLLITEIMADPNPSIALPDVEYLELYNASSGIIRLSDFSIMVGSNKKVLPDSLIESHQFIILCDEEDMSLLEEHGNIVGIQDFPSLTNSGATIKLTDNENILLHEVKYTDLWYRDPAKAEGGWSLEMINPFFICAGQDNWVATDHLSGGTPGKINSKWQTSPDTRGADFISIQIPEPDHIILRFSEKLDSLLVENINTYAVIPPVQVLAAKVVEDNLLEISFSENLQSAVSYSLLPFTIFDCLGNEKLISDTISFGLPVPPEKGDLVINEILFNPHPGGSRFIEIWNVSEKYIDPGKLSVGRFSGTMVDIYPINVDQLINPGELIVLAPDPSDILLRYTVPQPSLLFESHLPAWDEKIDNAALLSNGEVIDSFTYSSAWHLPIIADQNGVSLERLSSWTKSAEAHSWHSAASVSGNATPTGKNSQYLVSGAPEKPFSMVNKLFSPDDDGFKDFLALNFLLPDGDQIGSIRVHDLEGRAIKTLITNESLGTSAFVQWDGRNAEEVVAEMGIYVIFVELWDAQGNVKEYQETCALVKR